MAKLQLARRRVGLLSLVLGVCGCTYLWQALLFIAAGRLPQGPGRHQKSETTLARNAENAGPGGNDFSKFLKAQPKTKKKQEFMLSTEEFKMALEAEQMSQRRKYYIGGEIKPNNLVVPWRPISEIQIEKDARRILKKNGILDPDGNNKDNFIDDGVGSLALEDNVEVDKLRLVLYSGTVVLKWVQGDSEGKVGYIVERKRAQDSNFVELSTYDGQKNEALRVRDGENTEYDYEDDRPPEGTQVYRVLVRTTNGEIRVMDTQSVDVTRRENTTFLTGIIFLVGVFAFWFVVGFALDPKATYD